jgi:hypothetical protein
MIKKILKKIFYTSSILMPALSFAVSSQTASVDISAVNPRINEIELSDMGFKDLDLSTDAMGAIVCGVWVYSNDPSGFDLKFEFKNGGYLVNSGRPSDKIQLRNFTMKVENGDLGTRTSVPSSFVLSNTTPPSYTFNGDVSQDGNLHGASKITDYASIVVGADIFAPANLFAGTYSEHITISISAGDGLYSQ